MAISKHAPRINFKRRKKTRVEIYLGTHRKLKVLANDTGEHVYEVASRAIEEYIERQEAQP